MTLFFFFAPINVLGIIIYINSLEEQYVAALGVNVKCKILFK